MVKIEPVRFLLSVSRSLDFTHSGLLDHHLRVAYLSLVLGQAAGLSEAELFQLFKTAIIHDAGAVTWAEKGILRKFEIEGDARWEHCRRGFEFANTVQDLAPSAESILVHHDRWAGGNPSGFEKSSIPLNGRIIHLVDRIDILIQPHAPILQQSQHVLNQVQAKAGQEFDPDLVDLFSELQSESLWLDLGAPWLKERLLAILPSVSQPSIVGLVDIAQLFARVVDAKSRFTYRHSRGVASCARILGRELGCSRSECKFLEAAGLLHDLGKVTVPETILEKKGKLTSTEYSLIKQHAYYTYWLLQPATGDSPLVEWAAYHHERLDGNGYPFQKRAADLSLGARIVAVADVFTALREDRPYRSGMPWHKIERILRHQVSVHALDATVVETLLSNRQELDTVWEQLEEKN